VFLSLTFQIKYNKTGSFILRKLFLLIILFSIIFTGNLFANENEQDFDLSKNRIGFSVGIIGANLTYERMFSNNFSAVGQVSYINYIFADSLALSGKARLYPFGNSFFLDFGLGYSNGYRINVEEVIVDIILGIVTFGLWFTTEEFQEKDYGGERQHGLAIQPGLGWNIDLGKKDKVRLPVSMGLDIRAAKQRVFLPYLMLGLNFAF